MEAKAERCKITLTPKSLVDRVIVQGLDDLKKGRVHGPFETHEQMIDFLHSQAAKPKRKAIKRKR